MTIGIKLTPDTMVLTNGRDFNWAFQNLDANGEPTDFPDGSLLFELDTGEEPTVWTFTIEGDLAQLKVESEDVALIPDRTEWQLVWLPQGEAEGGDPVSIGKVRRQG